MNRRIILLLAFLAILTITSMAFLCSVRADSVTVLSSSSWVDSIGDYHISGEVQNAGSATVTYVEVTATIYNASNTVIDTQFAYADLTYMQPNTKSPFEILETTSTLVPEIDHYTLQLSSTDSGSIQQGLQITSNSSHIDDIGDLHVVGNIQNTGTAASSNTEVFATFYDSNGRVVDTGITYANPDTIVSGGSSPFDILCTDSTQIPLITSYSLTAQSSDYALIPEFSSWILLSFFVIAMLLSIVFIKKRMLKESSKGN